MHALLEAQKIDRISVNSLQTMQCVKVFTPYVCISFTKKFAKSLNEGLKYVSEENYLPILIHQIKI